MNGKLVDLVLLRDGTQRITFDTREDASQLFDKLKDKPVNISMKAAHKRRSLDANAYAWVLIDKLAEELGLTKTEVYHELIRNIGGASKTVCCPDEAVESVCDGWKKNGLGWFTETYQSKIDGCTNIILFFGSSTYDAKQMSALIDAAVQECKQYGIETMTEAERRAIEDAWASCR